MRDARDEFRRASTIIGLLTGILALLTSVACAATTLTLVAANQREELSLKILESRLKVHIVPVNTPEYRKEKVFDGFLLTDVLALVGLGQTEQDYEIAFTASDGYLTWVDSSELKSHKAFILFQEHGTAGSFEAMKKGNRSISPSPFYLVWPEGPEELPRPYQLTGIELFDSSTAFSRIRPRDVAIDSRPMQGFEIFKNNCLACHSMNGQGGKVGPELNAPKNVIEYWDNADLKKYIQNPAAYRDDVRMPAFPNLKDRDVRRLISYFRHMKSLREASQ